VKIMRRSIARLTGFVVLTVAAALFATAAFADTGNGNSAEAPGQVKAAQTPADPAAPPATPPGQEKKTAAASSTAGVKPSSTTAHGAHDTSCTTGGGTGSSATCTPGPKPDSSKAYGNGKTAAQIANAYVGPGQKLTGPGNSQPHKLCVHHPNPSGGQDEHSAKHGISSACAPAPAATPAVTSSVSTESSVQSTSVVQETVQSQTAIAAQAQAAAVVSSTPAVFAPAQVLGELSPLAAPKPHARGAVLGSIGRIPGSTLAFTGLALGAAVLAALALLGTGAVLRRRRSA
jgi:hypothetical protein